ncbi:uncharacterized protein LOC134336705 [Mobula hypostoma]|uniref:uncharacterized protein LOC134336705 n=1 Tax=Mobula hypostoma TaxID=723540 RepID=UPI002FC29DB6
MNENYQTRVSVDVEKSLREKFGWVLQRRVAELKLRSATQSPISGLVENAVVEKFEKTPCMQPFATNERMLLEASKALNVLYVYDGTFQPYLIYWLFPLQVAFKHSSSKWAMHNPDLMETAVRSTEEHLEKLLKCPLRCHCYCAIKNLRRGRPQILGFAYCLLPGPGSKRSAEMALSARCRRAGRRLGVFGQIRSGLWSDASRMLHRQVCDTGGSPSA